MTVYYSYDNIYPAPLGYEHTLLPQKDEEIINLKNQLAIAHGVIVERDDKISALELKNKYLLDGYNKRQLSYATALTVLQSKNKEDVVEIEKLKEENFKLKKHVEEKKKLSVSKVQVEKDRLKKKLAALTKEVADRKYALNEIKNNKKNNVKYYTKAIGQPHQLANCKIVKGTHYVSDIESLDVCSDKATEFRMIKGVHNVADIETAFFLQRNKRIESNEDVTTQNEHPSKDNYQECEVIYNGKFGSRCFC